MTTGSLPPKRSRVRSILPIGLALWLALEIWVLILVGSKVGALTVLALLIAGAVLGGTIIKRAGRNAYRNLAETLQRQQRGETPESGANGNGFLMLAGGLIMLPGFISDAVGLVLLVPPVRTFLSRAVERSIERRIQAAAPGSLGDAFNQARMRRPDGKVVPGEVIHPEPSAGGAGSGQGAGSGAEQEPRIIEGKVIRPDGDPRP
ncbi:FxsA family membrane protein [Streptomyces sp. NPDC047315]|uniref:FxsA family membrane protein n=1 Tax=Streptomyces sp. NPDC047315 TaxID=3155142 RepID=UPI0033D8C1CB